MALTPLPRIAAAALAVCLTTAPASAWHEPARPVTDYSAATLNSGEWRIYLGTLLEYGITDNLEIGTLPVLDLLRVPNLQAKWAFIPGEGFGMAASAGFLTTNPRYFRDDAPDVQVYAIPLALFTSWRFPGGDLGLHAGLHYTAVGSTGALDLKDAFGFDAAADLRGSTLKVAPVIELRTSRSFAWVIEGSLSLSQSAQGAATTTFTSEDKRTTVEIIADGAVESSGKWLGNASLSGYWSWETFNLRLGLGYGHAELPMFGVFADYLSILPKFNAYWRF